MSWLRIEDLHDRMELVTVSDADAKWICGGSGTTRKPQNYSLSYSNDTAAAVKVGSNTYQFGVSADAKFNMSADPSKNGGSVNIHLTPYKF